MAVAPEKALVLATTRCMLYGEDPPCTWEWGSCISLTTFPRSPSALPTCICMCGMLRAQVRIRWTSWIPPASYWSLVSEMSNVVPVAMLHPVFQDMGSKEAMDKTGKPLAPLWFQGFRLHTVLSQPPGGEPTHQIALFLVSEGMPPHPCWSMSQRSFPRVCGRGLRCR